MAVLLEASGHYRMLRRIGPRASVEIPAGVPTRLGLLLDLDTTGLDARQHEIIEMAMLPFTYGLDGTVHSVGEPSQSRPRSPNSPA
jgi:DNA polymerase-3 subunit epsilon